MAAAAVADEVTEAMEQVEGEREEADAVADEAAEVMEQAEGEREEAIDAVAGEAGEVMKEVVEGEREEANAMADEADEAMEPEGEREEEADAVADEATEPMEQVEGEGEDGDAAAQRPALPLGRVKRIIRVDRDIKKVTNEAALLIAAATELFVGSSPRRPQGRLRRGRRACVPCTCGPPRASTAPPPTSSSTASPPPRRRRLLARLPPVPAAAAEEERQSRCHVGPAASTRSSRRPPSGVPSLYVSNASAALNVWRKISLADETMNFYHFVSQARFQCLAMIWYDLLKS